MSRSTRLDWARSMAVEWSWWRVDPSTWRDVEPLGSVVSADMTYDADTSTYVSASLETDDYWGGELWARCYLDATQRGVRERICIATVMCESPRREVGVALVTTHVDGYGPLRALSDERVGIGWSITEGTPALHAAASVARQYGIAPVVEPVGSTYVMDETWVAGDNDTALDVVTKLAAKAGHEVTCDPDGRTCLVPSLRTSALAPVVTLDGSRDAGILLPGVSEETDWLEVPNVVEVVHSENSRTVLAIASNDDPNSPLSTVSRGRRVVARVVDPDELGAGATQEAADMLARKLLADRSCRVRTVQYTRGFDPRIECGDCVRVLLPEHGIDVTGRVTRQDLSCTTEATVRETVTVQERVW